MKRYSTKFVPNYAFWFKKKSYKICEWINTIYDLYFFSDTNNAYFLLLLLQRSQYILPVTHTLWPGDAVSLFHICSCANSLQMEPCLSFMLRCTLPMTLSTRFKRNSVSCGWEPRRLYSPFLYLPKMLLAQGVFLILTSSQFTFPPRHTLFYL